ncbi:putative transcription factor interactor and regulator CCHC(Zn) family [Helianthus annuus]|nr:putative transcription factor interactor and regulator CCHC(Zn) family [Helianthus annuus]
MVCREPFTGTKTILSHKIVHCLLNYLLCVNLNQMASHDSAANTYHNSAANMHDIQQSGIRASISISDNLRPTSSMMPCAHCSEEKRDRRRMECRCYYCNMPGHQISSCQEKDEENQLLRQAVNAGIQEGSAKDNNHQVEERLEFILDGTDGGYWSDMWYVSKSLKRHFCNNIDMFKRIKNMSHVETKTGENHFFFIRGVGVVDVVSGSEKIRIQSVLYTTDIDRNVLSYDQLITQGFTVKFMGDRCKIYPTFSIPINNKRNSHSGMTREEELGELEKQSVIEKGHEHEKYKTDFLNDYFEKLNLSASEPDWNILILQAMKWVGESPGQAWFFDMGIMKSPEVVAEVGKEEPLPVAAAESSKKLGMYFVESDTRRSPFAGGYTTLGTSPVNIHGKPIPDLSKTGGWLAAFFIFGNEMAERMAYFGLSVNMVAFMFYVMHLPFTTSANAINNFLGISQASSLIGGFLADAYLGRYWTIAIFTTLYLLGLSGITLCATLNVLAPNQDDCNQLSLLLGNCEPAKPWQMSYLYTVLYLTGFGAAGIRPCVSSFGADQFDERSRDYNTNLDRFFNFFYLSVTLGPLSHLLL